MPERIPQSTALRVQFPAYLSTDHISNATAKTIAITLSKNGGAFGNPSAGATNATEVANGDYYVDLSTTDTGTLGPLVVRGAVSGIDDVKVYYNVVKATNGGYSALPDAAAEAAGGLYTRGTGAGQINQPANGQVDANAVKVGGTAQTGRDLGASVLLSPGTGTGQVDLSSGQVKVQSGTGSGQLDVTGGVIKSNVAQILGTALTETVGGYLTAAFKKLFDVAAPVLTSASVNQTGDTYARIGAAGAGLTAVGDTRLAHLDADVSSRSTFAGGAVDSVTGNVGGNVVGSVGSVTASVTVGTNSDKTGYSLTQAFPSNFASLVIDSSGRVNAFLIGILTTVFTEGATGRIAAAFKQFFNIATPAATMDHGVLVDTVTTYTGDTPQTGDVYARIGAAGGGLTALGDTRIANLDTTVSSRLATSGYTAPLDAAGTRSAVGLASANLDSQLDALPTAAETATAVRTELTTELGRLDAAVTTRATPAQVKTQADQALADVGVTTTVTGWIDTAISTRLATSGYTAPDNADIVAIKAKTDNLPASPAATSDIPTAAVVADAVWDEALSGHTTAGSAGAALSGAGDPWSTPLPGAYADGTAGQILGDNLDVAVSSRSAVGDVARVILRNNSR